MWKGNQAERKVALILETCYHELNEADLNHNQDVNPDEWSNEVIQAIEEGGSDIDINHPQFLFGHGILFASMVQMNMPKLAIYALSRPEIQLKMDEIMPLVHNEFDMNVCRAYFFHPNYNADNQEIQNRVRYHSCALHTTEYGNNMCNMIEMHMPHWNFKLSNIVYEKTTCKAIINYQKDPNDMRRKMRLKYGLAPGDSARVFCLVLCIESEFLSLVIR